MKLILALLLAVTCQHTFAQGLPPTTSKVSGDASDKITFKYQFPNFTGTHTGSTLSLGINSVAGGGTGLGTLTSGSLLVGAGTSNITFIAPGTSGNILQSNGSAWVSSPSTLSSVTLIASMSGSTQTIANTTSTTVVFGTSISDPGSYYNTSTGVFTPLVSGTYIVCALIEYTPNAATGIRIIYLYKNNAQFSTLADVQAGASAQMPGGCGMVTMNGTTDNIRINTYQNKGSSETLTGNTSNNLLYIARVGN
jgi:hypothetical protein